MGDWRDFQQERRDVFNTSALNRLEDKYLTPPEDVEREDQADYFDEMSTRRFERTREDI